MKKVGLVTLDSRMYNYGGVLQEYALCRIMEENGYNIEIIDIDLSSLCRTFSIRRSIFNINLDKIRGKIKEACKAKNSSAVEKVVSARQSKFDEFRRNRLKFSPIYTANELEKIEQKYDCFVCGSDQIWNPSFNYPEFFLTFVNKKPRVIYGASIGKAKLSSRQLKIYTELLKSPDAISVREHSAKCILQPCTDKKISVVLDPTLLLKKEEWLDIMPQESLTDEKYIFCYYLENQQEKQDAAKRLAEANGLKIVTLPFLLGEYEEESVNFGDYQLDAVGPLEFLRLIYDAEIVLTDSFHASLFSILFRKDFWVFSRNMGNYNMNTRLDTLLEYFNLKNRMIDCQYLFCNKHCKYADYYEKFEKTQKDSVDYLFHAINGYK